MKKLVLILFLLVTAFLLRAQLITTTKVTNNTTAFGETISVDEQVYDKYACKLYVCTTEAASDETLTTASEKFILVTNFNRIKDSYNDLFQGLAWSSVDNEYNRMGSIIDESLGSSPGNAKLPIQSQMKRCLLKNDGTVSDYLDPNNSYYLDDGMTVADSTGASGQWMVEIPKFYYRVEYAEDYRYWAISPFKLPGFTLHPAFIKDGVEVNYRYYSAFEGSLWDSSESAMCAKASISSNIYATGDSLCSIPSEWAKTNERWTEYREAAEIRGDGWRMLDFTLNSAVQLLYLVEYGDFDSQSTIGMGRTELSDGTWTADSYIGKTGLSKSDGNGTNSVSNGGTSGYLTDYMTYRGIENWYGNVWKMLEGITWDGGWTGTEAAQPVYYTNNSEYFKCEGHENMFFLTDANYIGGNSGYIADLENTFGFIPSSIGSSSLISDHYYQYSESGRDYWRLVRFGRDANYGNVAGGFSLDVNSVWSTGATNITGRLTY